MRTAPYDVAYDSCRDRHCPECRVQRPAIARRTPADLLAVPYYHVVLTMPAAIADIAYQNEAVVYLSPFKASTETMLTLRVIPSTWRPHRSRICPAYLGSTLTQRPHVHMIVPGGGIALDGSRSVSCRSRFFLPWRMLANYSAADASKDSSLHMPPVDRSGSAAWSSWRAPPSPPFLDAAAGVGMVRLGRRPFAGPERIGLSVPLPVASPSPTVG